MDKKFCDKCKREIKESEVWYSITIWEEPEGEDEGEKKLEYCQDCYEKIDW